jgi:hypothetical protein
LTTICEVLVRAAGEAVVADDAVGDEVAGARGDVVQREVDAERFDRRDREVRRRAQHHAVQLVGGRVRGIGGVQEPQVLPQPAGQAVAAHAAAVACLLDHVREVEAPQRRHDVGQRRPTCATDPQVPSGEVAVHVEHASQVPLVPLLARHVGTPYRQADRLLPGQELPGPLEHPRVDRLAVPRGDARQVAALVVHAALRRGGEVPGADQPVAGHEDPALVPARARRDVPPAAVGEEAVLTAGDELRAVPQRDAEGGFVGGPVREHARGDVPATVADPLRAVDPVAGLQLGQGSGAAVRHEDRGVAREAVPAGVAAPPVRVDGPAERHPRRAGHLVQHGLGAHLVEDDAVELRGAHSAHQPGEPGQCLLAVVVDALVFPSHGHSRTHVRSRVNSNT